ncbi:MAG TPA: DUF1549 domain-containing protein, partial [Gemmataceae bacterium]
MDVARPSSPSALFLGLLTLLAADPVSPAGERAVPCPSPRETATRIDAAFQRSLPVPVEDETFLRRVSLDLAGKLPGPEEMQRWNADRAADKRVRLIDRLLHSEAYTINWGRYWRDAVTYNAPASA